MNSFWNLSFYNCFNRVKDVVFLGFKKLFIWFFKKYQKTFLISINNLFLLYKNLLLFKTYERATHRIFIIKTTKYKQKSAKQRKITIINDFVLLFIFHKSSLLTKFWQFDALCYKHFIKQKTVKLLKFYKQTLENGLIYITGALLTFSIDSLITDDEPLWEPVEWSLIQTWIFFIFIFAWIAENLITSRYGSYTGRDKKVWLAWYKTFWLLELLYLASYVSAALFVIVPFYYELAYSTSFVFSWWNWYTRLFFFKFTSLYVIVLLIAYLFHLNIRWLNWKKLLLFVLLINFFLAYLIYINFIMSFFGYFTDPLWYQKTRFIDYVQLSHEPLKWGWGPAKRDHFTYHKVSTVFWFKNDGPFAGAFLLFHLFYFIFTFLLYFYWLALLRRVFVTKEVTYTFATYCVSSLKHFFYFSLLIYLAIVASFVINYWRFPIEFLWVINSHSWIMNFLIIIKDYFIFILYLF